MPTDLDAGAPDMGPITSYGSKVLGMHSGIEEDDDDDVIPSPPRFDEAMGGSSGGGMLEVMPPDRMSSASVGPPPHLANHGMTDYSSPTPDQRGNNLTHSVRARVNLC